MLLEPNESVNAMLFRESINLVVLVFPNALDQIGGHTSVPSSIAFASKNVNRGVLHVEKALDSGFRRNDEQRQERRAGFRLSPE